MTAWPCPAIGSKLLPRSKPRPGFHAEAGSFRFIRPDSLQKKEEGEKGRGSECNPFSNFQECRWRVVTAREMCHNAADVQRSDDANPEPTSTIHEAELGSGATG